ncbi:MAG: hypothetical protein ACREC5_03590 [Thermoplasmata archaeon]
MDLSESPPVPAEDPGGDVRLGFWITGTLCLVVGWIVGVAANLLLHHAAPSGGWRLGTIWIGPAMGPYAWATFAFGIVVGLFGIVLYHLARGSPPGPFRLPGHPY